MGEATYFCDTKGNRLGSHEEFLSIPLYEGMTITIHGHEGEFAVKEWNYHHGHPDEEARLQIILRKKDDSFLVDYG